MTMKNDKKDMEKTNRLASIGLLAATVAHELRNPLAVIQTATFNIKAKRVNKDIDKNIANIEKKLYESNQIINNLLTYSNIKSPVRKDMNLCDTLEEAIFFAGKRFQGANVSIQKEFHCSEINITGDPLQLKEVFANILNNAFQAMNPRKKGIIKVKANVAEGKEVVIEIIDNGKGMDEDDLGKAFEPFFSKKSRGVGLGLAISAEIINLHDGSIDIKSRKGSGTELRIILPFNQA